MGGRASIGVSVSALTTLPAAAAAQRNATAQPAKTILLGPIPTKTLPKKIRRPLTAFERVAMLLDPTTPFRFAAKAIAGFIAKRFPKLGRILGAIGCKIRGVLDKIKCVLGKIGCAIIGTAKKVAHAVSNFFKKIFHGW